MSAGSDESRRAAWLFVSWFPVAAASLFESPAVAGPASFVSRLVGRRRRRHLYVLVLEAVQIPSITFKTEVRLILIAQ